MNNKNKEMSFTSLFTVDARNSWKPEEIGLNFKTDGSQVILRYIELISIEIRGSIEKVN